MPRGCLSERTLIVLLAGDAPVEPWRAHIESCPRCHALWARQQAIKSALERGFAEPTSEWLARSRPRLVEALSAPARPVAYYDVRPNYFVGPLLMAVSDRGLCALTFRQSEG